MAAVVAATTAACGGEAMTPPPNPDPTSIFRIFKRTIQRVKCSFISLNSYASFIIFSDRLDKLVIWIGKHSDTHDKTMARRLGKELRREMPNNGPVFLCVEENEHSEALSHLLSLLWMSDEEYRKEAINRVNPHISNAPKILSILERIRGSGGQYKLRNVCTVIPDSTTGEVPRIPWPRFTSTQMAVLLVADQYDLWIGEDIVEAEVKFATQMVSSLATDKKSEGMASLAQEKLDLVLFGQNMRVVKHTYERCIFRAHFDAWAYFGISKIRMHEPVMKLIGDKDDKLETSGVCSTDYGCMQPEITAVASALGLGWLLSTGAEASSDGSSGSSAPKHPDEDPFTSFSSSDLSPALIPKSGRLFKDPLGALLSLDILNSTSQLQQLDPVNELTEKSFAIKPSENVTDEQADQEFLKVSSEPRMLVGWQVNVDPYGVGVVVDARYSRSSRRPKFLLQFHGMKKAKWMFLKKKGYDKGDHFGDEFDVILLRRVARPDPLIA